MSNLIENAVKEDLVVSKGIIKIMSELMVGGGSLHYEAARKGYTGTVFSGAVCANMAPLCRYLVDYPAEAEAAEVMRKMNSFIGENPGAAVITGAIIDLVPLVKADPTKDDERRAVFDVQFCADFAGKTYAYSVTVCDPVTAVCLYMIATRVQTFANFGVLLSESLSYLDEQSEF